MISDLFIRKPHAAWGLTILLCAFGIYAFRLLPVSMYPKIIPPQIEIYTEYPGADIATVEDSILRPIEEKLFGLEGVDYFESSVNSKGEVISTLTLAPDADEDMVLVRVQNKIKEAEAFFPAAVNKKGVTVEKIYGNILMAVNLFSPTGSMDQTEISNYASRFIVPKLQKIPGTALVEIHGEMRYSMRVWLDPEKMNAYQITVTDIANAINEQTSTMSSGVVGQPPYSDGFGFQYSLLSPQKPETVKEYENIVVRTGENGGMLYLKDVATLELGASRYNDISRLNSHQNVMVAIYQYNDANALEISDATHKKMSELEKNFPEGMEQKILYDTTKYIRSYVNNVLWTLILAIAIVIPVVYIFLGNWSATLVTAVVIPISLISTFCAIYLLGYSINLISLFAMILAIGIVVDDAILVVENVDRLMKTEGMGAREATIKTMKQVTNPIVATTVVLLAVFVPVAFIPGITGKIYQQFAIVLSVSVTVSSILALSLTPALCASIPAYEKKNKTTRKELFGLFDRMQSSYMSFFRLALEKKYLSVLAYCVIVGLAALLFYKVPKGFVPVEDHGFFLVASELPEGASIDRTVDVMNKIAGDLNSIDGITNTMTVSGFNFIGGAASNLGLGYVILDDYAVREDGGLTIDGILSDARDALSKIYEASIIAFNPPPIPGLGTVAGFEFRLLDESGTNGNELGELAKKIIDAARSRKEISNIYTNYKNNTPQFRIEVDREKAKYYGIELDDIFTTLQTQLGSSYVDDFVKYGKVYEVILQANEQFRDAPSDLSHYYVKNSKNEFVPISVVAKLIPEFGPTTVNHFNVSRSISIGGQSSEGYSSGDAIRAMEQVADEILPQGIGYEWAGQSRQEKRSGEALLLLVGMGLLLVFIALLILYESWLLPLVIILSMPVAIFGGLLALKMFGLTNNIYAQLGLLVSLGVCAKTSILIVDFAAKNTGKANSMLQAMLDSMSLRLRAVFMTAATFIFGVLPLLLSGGPGAAARGSLGITVIGAMLFFVFLGISFIPVLYVVLSKNVWERKLVEVPA